MRAREVALVAPTNVHRALVWSTDCLGSSPTARLDAELLLGHVLGRSRSWIVAHFDDPLNATQIGLFHDSVWRRAGGEPVAYIRGFVEWYGHTLEVISDVLVPRPETELLVALAERIVGERDSSAVLDIGTGSGAIAIALALAKPRCRVVATDVSGAALAVAARNVQKHGLKDRIEMVCGDLLDIPLARPDLIVANLPYLSDDMMNSVAEPVRHEPAFAVRAGPSGLELYERLLAQMRERDWLMPLLIEIDPRQARDALDLCGGYFDYADIAIVEDLAGLDRAIRCLPTNRHPVELRRVVSLAS